MKNSWFQFILLLLFSARTYAQSELTAGSLHTAATVIATNTQPLPSYIVTLRRAADQHVTSLSLSNQWTNLTSTNGTGSLTTVTATDPTPSAMRFYRLARQTTP